MSGNIGIEYTCALTYVSRFYPPHLTNCCVNAREERPAPKTQQNGYDSRYTFSAKEKDDETQYSYFGARYYDSDLSVWLSVDPMSDKYPSMSPYMYCAGNPLINVELDGNIFVHYTKIKDEAGDNISVKITFDGSTVKMYNRSNGDEIKYNNQSEFVNNMVTAYNYIVDNGADVDNAMQTVAKSDKEVDVVEVTKGASYSNGEIEMDFNYGLKIYDEKGTYKTSDDVELGVQSPALGFWSEVYHAYLDLFDLKTKKDLGDDLQAEEDFVHLNKEYQVIDALEGKEPKRTQYSFGDGWPVKTKGVTSNEEE